MKLNKIAFIETPNQCLFLNGVCVDIHNTNIFLVRRKKWPVPESKIKDFFHGNIKTINGIESFMHLILKKTSVDEVYIGSHLGVQNKFLIIFSLILNYKVYLLDDGLYSIYYPKWVLSLMSFFSKLQWLSFYQRDHNYYKNNVQTYCLLPYINKSSHKDKVFLILSNFSMLNIDKSREAHLISEASKIAQEKSMQLVVLPHRRGRHEMYSKMSLNVLDMKNLCFEDWYLGSQFKNCITIAYASSIWGILEDNRTENILVDFGLHTPYWILSRVKISKILKI